MASGVEICDEVKELFNTMKVNRNSDVAKERIRVAVFGLSDNEKSIITKQVIKEKDLDELGNVFRYIQGLMKDGECTYILYDCHYETTISKKEDLMFIMWSCDNASIRKRMLYSSSKKSLDKDFDVKFKFELHSRDEKTVESVVKKMGKENITKLEGLDAKDA